eukprot:778279-Pelagomonas_calceolata.AAC.2
MLTCGVRDMDGSPTLRLGAGVDGGHRDGALLRALPGHTLPLQTRGIQITIDAGSPLFKSTATPPPAPEQYDVSPLKVLQAGNAHIILHWCHTPTGWHPVAAGTHRGLIQNSSCASIAVMGHSVATAVWRGMGMGGIGLRWNGEKGQLLAQRGQLAFLTPAFDVHCTQDGSSQWHDISGLSHHAQLRRESNHSHHASGTPALPVDPAACQTASCFVANLMSGTGNTAKPSSVSNQPAPIGAPYVTWCPPWVAWCGWLRSWPWPSRGPGGTRAPAA